MHVIVHISYSQNINKQSEKDLCTIYTDIRNCDTSSGFRKFPWYTGDTKFSSKSKAMFSTTVGLKNACGPVSRENTDKHVSQ